MSRVRSAGSAHAGVAEWLLQRVTSLYMGGFVIYAIVHLSLSPVRDYTAWKTWFATGYVRIAWALFLASILIHAWVGMRSIYLDYLHPLVAALQRHAADGTGPARAGAVGGADPDYCAS